MTKDQLDGLKGVFELSEKLDKVLNKSSVVLMKARIGKVSIRYESHNTNDVCIMSIEDGERVTINSSVWGTLSISDKKRATLAALADMIGTALVSTLKEEHEEIKAKIESWKLEE